MSGDSGYCANCAAMAAQLAAAQQQIAMLEARVRQLENRVQTLERVIQLARATCLGFMARAQETLSQPSGVPRAAWAYNKAAYLATAAVLAVLGGAG